MIRLLVVSYCYGIRSERRLYEEAHLIVNSKQNAFSTMRQVFNA